MTDRPLIRFHDPPGINPGLIRRAVDIVVETCSPRTVYLVGPTAIGYVEYNMVKLLVIVDEGDTNQLWDDITWALTDEFIDGEVSVYTIEEFDEWRDNSYTSAYDAVNSGRIAYERDSAEQAIDSGDAFYDHVMEVAPRVGRMDSDGVTVLPADWDDPLDEVYSAMDANKNGFACILDEDIIGAVFTEAVDTGATLYLSRAGALQLKLPLPVQVSHDVRWTVAPIGLQVHGTGDTPIEALEDMVAAFNEALELFCGPEVPSDDPTKMMFAAYVRFDTEGKSTDERTDSLRKEREPRDKVAVEIARLAQGTPIVGYHD